MVVSALQLLKALSEQVLLLIEQNIWRETEEWSQSRALVVLRAKAEVLTQQRQGSQCQQEQPTQQTQGQHAASERVPLHGRKSLHNVCP